MIDAETVAQVVRSFADPSDGQSLKSCELVLGLLAGSDEPFSRYQFTPGHITCTGLVFSADGERLLLVHHRRLGRWLAPGGHVEAADVEIWDAAAREVSEETGVVLAPNAHPALAGADVHGIPAKGAEPYHLHHDLLFAFRAVSGDLLLSEESIALAWSAPSEFDRYAVPANLRRAYARMRELSSTR